MSIASHPQTLSVQRLLVGLLLVCMPSLSACQRAEKTDTSALDQAGMYFNSISELQALKISNAEIAELAVAKQAGLSDASCIQMVRLARGKGQTFTDGQSIASLLAAGMSEPSVLQLAHLNQLGIWSGEAQAMRLAGLSDQVIVAVAHRIAQHLPVLSGEKLAELKNSGASDAAILEMVQRGVSEAEAAYYVAARQNAAGGHGFVYQRRGKNR